MLLKHLVNKAFRRRCPREQEEVKCSDLGTGRKDVIETLISHHILQASGATDFFFFCTMHHAH